MFTINEYLYIIFVLSSFVLKKVSVLLVSSWFVILN